VDEFFTIGAHVNMCIRHGALPHQLLVIEGEPKKMRRFSILVGVIALAALFTSGAAAKKVTIRGQLARTVEAGGWLIISETNEATTKYLLLNARRFQNEKWFRAGARIEAKGETRPGAMTIYQEGVPFEASAIRPLGDQAGTGAQTASYLNWPSIKLSAFGLSCWQSSPNLV
jgi:hypothetical protein